MLSTQVEFKEALNILKRSTAPDHLPRYAESLYDCRNRNSQFCPKRQVRDFRGIVLEEEKSLAGLTIVVRYEAASSKLYEGERTLDEVAVLWVPVSLRGKGFGKTLFKQACLDILDCELNPRWIYMQATDTNAWRIGDGAAQIPNLLNSSYSSGSVKNFIFDVRSGEKRRLLREYCQRT